MQDLQQPASTESEKQFFVYTQALERGDLDIVQAILAQAEQNPALAQMISDLNDLYAEQELAEQFKHGSYSVGVSGAMENDRRAFNHIHSDKKEVNFTDKAWSVWWVATRPEPMQPRAFRLIREFLDYNQATRLRAKLKQHHPDFSKKCERCAHVRDITQFRALLGQDDGLSSICKECEAATTIAPVVERGTSQTLEQSQANASVIYYLQNDYVTVELKSAQPYPKRFKFYSDTPKQAITLANEILTSLGYTALAGNDGTGVLITPAIIYRKDDGSPETAAKDAAILAAAPGCIGEISQKEFEIFMLGHELGDSRI